MKFTDGRNMAIPVTAPITQVISGFGFVRSEQSEYRIADYAIFVVTKDVYQGGRYRLRHAIYYFIDDSFVPLIDENVIERRLQWEERRLTQVQNVFDALFRNSEPNKTLEATVDSRAGDF